MWTYRYECKKLQSWICAGGKLREMVAASDLIASLAKQRKEFARALGLEEGLAPPDSGAPLRYQLLADAAGGCTLLFASFDALGRFAAHWPARLAVEAPGLTLVQGWAAGEGGDALAAVRDGLRDVRNRVFPTLPQPGPLAERTSRTGLGAVERQNGRLLDAASRAKNNAERSKKREPNELDARFGVDVRSDETTILGTDLDFPEGLVAMVHADGNGIGSWLTNNTLDPEQFRLFSARLAEATQAAAATATAAIRDAGARVGKRHNVLPMRPLVLGGDDVTLLVAARWAIPWTAAFLDAFERETATRKVNVVQPGAKFTACAGVVFCKRKWPMAQAHHLAEELCGSAKKQLRQLGGRGRSGLLFHRVLGGQASSWESICKGELGDGRLVGGPYLVGDAAPGLATLDQLASVADAVDRDLPNTVIRGLVDSFVTDPERAASDWQRARAVLGDDKARQRRTIEGLEAAGVDWETGCWANSEASSDGGDDGDTAEASTPLRDAIVWNRVQPGAKVQRHQEVQP